MVSSSSSTSTYRTPWRLADQEWASDPSMFTPMEAYPFLLESLKRLEPERQRAHVRYLARTDLWFLLRYLCKRRDMEHSWIFERVQEVQRYPDGFLDLWARDHYKSTIITFGLTLQDILGSHGEDPLPRYGGREVTVGIFSHSRPIAKAFLQQIMREFETNEDMQRLFPDVLYGKPKVEAPKWSEDQGIVVRRRSNPKEATVEAWGLVDGQPTSKHFTHLIYDDVVVRASVTTPEMMKKTTEAWEHSLNLGTKKTVHRYTGTKYHYNDTYRIMEDRSSAIPRKYPATVDGSIEGEPVLLSKEQLAKKRRDMGPYTFASQMLVNPVADALASFKREHFGRYSHVRNWQTMTRYILVDPANAKKRDSDYTAAGVVGLSSTGRYYLLDLVRDRLNLAERAHLVLRLHSKWSEPGNQVRGVAYEQYGKDADIDHIKHVQDEENYRFHITPVPRPGQPKLAKYDRIMRLVPDMDEELWWFPEVLWYTNTEGVTLDLMHALVEEEALPFPVPVHDDMLDMLSRIYDLNLSWPRQTDPNQRDRYAQGRRADGRSWMSG